MATLSDTQLRQLAHKRVEFRSHLFVYCIVIGALWIIWFFTGSRYIWPVWPMVGWGIGLVFHYVFEYRSARFLSEEDEYNKLKKELEEHDRVVHSK
jgi:hypothetical protein